MSGSQDYLTTQEFAKKAGVSASTVTKWLRSNKINGKKKSGKWMISPGELAKLTSTQRGETEKPSETPSLSKSHSGAKAYSIQEFSAMTYLTEYGVSKWLKEGRLKGASDDSGQPLVASSNLEDPNIKRLIR